MSWPVFKLGEICKIISGSTPSRTKPELWNGYIHWITPKDLDESRILELHSSPETITDKGLKSCSTQILPVNSVLFSSRAPIGLVAVNKIPLCTNQGFKSLIPGEKTHYKYLAYWLKANRLQLQAMGNGATFKELSKSVFEKVEIPLPPLEVQKKIAAVLEKADALRRKREEQIKRLDDLLQATFLDMFGDPVTNPKGWPIIKLKDVVDKVTSGSTPKGGESSYLSEGILFVRSQNVLMQSLDLDKAAFIGSDVHQSMKRSALEHLDVLLNITGASIGRVAVFDLKEQANVNQHVCLIRCKMQEIEPYFLASQIGSANFQQKYISMNSGATREAFNYEEIKNFNLILPPMQLQKQFKLFLNKTKESLNSVKKTDFESLFNSLMQRAFKGELDLI